MSLQADMFGNYGSLKRCACCGRVKELFEFNRLGDGYQSYCKSCQRQYHQRHPSKEYKRKSKDYSLEISYESISWEDKDDRTGT